MKKFDITFVIFWVGLGILVIFLTTFIASWFTERYGLLTPAKVVAETDDFGEHY